MVERRGIPRLRQVVIDAIRAGEDQRRACRSADPDLDAARIDRVEVDCEEAAGRRVRQSPVVHVVGRHVARIPAAAGGDRGADFVPPTSCVLHDSRSSPATCRNENPPLVT